VTGRKPVAAELALLGSSLEKYIARFKLSPSTAEELLAHGEAPRDKLLDVAELAAHTAICSVLLNLDESVSKN
jgi:hypothetical protein